MWFHASTRKPGDDPLGASDEAGDLEVLDDRLCRRGLRAWFRHEDGLLAARLLASDVVRVGDELAVAEDIEHDVGPPRG